MKISISLWSGDLTNLGEVIRTSEEYADYFHFDVADGHFVPNFLFFPDLIKALRPLTAVPFDVHLMIEEPERFLSVFVDAGADILAIHPKACKNPEGTLMKIKEQGRKASIVLDSHVPTKKVKMFARLVDFIVVMGTPPGVKGCSLLPETYNEIRQVKKYLLDAGREDVQIVADGGVRKETAPKLARAGANILVLGSLFFKNKYDQITNWLRVLGSEKPLG